MKSRDSNLLRRTVAHAAEMFFKMRTPDFLDSLQLQSFHIKEAYFDVHDGRPVTIIGFHTHPSAARNESNSLHSGALCVIVDHLSTLGSFCEPSLYDDPPADAAPDDPAPMKEEILANLGKWMGVSRNIKLHVQRPTLCDSDVTLKVKLLENSPSSSYLDVKGYDADGNILFSGTHDKTKLRGVIKPKL